MIQSNFLRSAGAFAAGTLMILASSCSDKSQSGMHKGLGTVTLTPTFYKASTLQACFFVFLL